MDLARFALALIAAVLGTVAGWSGWRVVRRYAGADSRPGPLATIAATSTAFAWAALTAPPGWMLAASLVLAWTLVTLAAIDLAAFRLPDALTLPLLVVGLASGLLIPGAPIADRLAGAIGGYGAFALLSLAWRRWRGVDALGMGDAKLLGAAGAWLGWRLLPTVVLIACVASLAFVAVRATMRGGPTLRAKIPFGAPLCAAFWIAWLYAAQLQTLVMAG